MDRYMNLFLKKWILGLNLLNKKIKSSHGIYFKQHILNVLTRF